MALTIISLLTVSLSAYAQGKYHYKIDADEELAPDWFEESLDSKDSLSFIGALQKDITQLWTLGYLTATVDTIIRSRDSLIAQVHLGDEYRYGKIEISPTNQAIVAESGLKNFRWKDKYLSPKHIDYYSESLLTYLENNGYPFARVHIGNIQITNGTLDGELVLDRNKFVPFDSIKVIGQLNLKRSYLDRYLDIRVNDPYNRQKIKNIDKRLADLPFIEVDTTTQIQFSNDYAQVQLYLKDKKASRFDFLIGVLPTNQGGDRRFKITGEFTAEMYNRLGRGEYLYARLQSLDPTRQLDLRFKYPYLYDLPIGTDITASIFFNEEFRETKFDAGLLYQFDGNSALKASWNRKSSRLITLDSLAIATAGRLPNKLDLTYNGGGIEYSNADLDYRFNPSKGYQISIGGTIGLKKILKNNTIESFSNNEVDFSEAYDTLRLNTLQTELYLKAAYYIPAFKVGALKLSTEGGLKYNQDRIYDNELHRIGGNRLLRGFDEQSVLTDAFLVSTAEFRLLLDRNSYLSFPFIDYGLTRIRVDDEVKWDNALSFGMGINFATPAGIFNVSFAAGRRLDNPFDFGNTKIHFGYVSLF